MSLLVSLHCTVAQRRRRRGRSTGTGRLCVASCVCGETVGACQEERCPASRASSRLMCSPHSRRILFDRYHKPPSELGACAIEGTGFRGLTVSDATVT
jgi:hypothetical protein